jgi:hypothetical protein
VAFAQNAYLLLAASTLNPSASTLNLSFAACLQGFAFFQYVDVTNNDKCIAGLHGMQVWLLCSAIARRAGVVWDLVTVWKRHWTNGL